MNRIFETFQKPKVLLPVVHCLDTIQTQEAVACAFENGADGVFLINQGGMPIENVLTRAMAVAEGRWAGVNLLGYTATDALTMVRRASIRAGKVLRGVWCDDAKVVSSEEVRFAALTQNGWRGPYGETRPLYFGGVAFKHRAHVPDEMLGIVANRAASEGVDVVTTSGPQTGTPPTVEKAMAMREGLGSRHALAIASGITPKNVRPFLPYVDAFLVATGIEKRFGTFDPGKVRALADAIHAGATS